MKVPYDLDFTKRQALISCIFLVLRVGFLLIIQKEKAVSINWDIPCLGVYLILDILLFFENKKRIKRGKKTMPQYRVIYKKYVYILCTIIFLACLGVLLIFPENIAVTSLMLHMFIIMMIDIIFDWKKSTELYR